MLRGRLLCGRLCKSLPHALSFNCRRLVAAAVSTQAPTSRHQQQIAHAAARGVAATKRWWARATPGGLSVPARPHTSHRILGFLFRCILGPAPAAAATSEPCYAAHVLLAAHVCMRCSPQPATAPPRSAPCRSLLCDPAQSPTTTGGQKVRSSKKPYSSAVRPSERNTRTI